MAIYPIGYDRIVRTWNLPARPPWIGSAIDTGANRRRQDRLPDGRTLQIFDEGYDKGAGLRRDLLFSLRYEGVNLEILSFLFRKAGEEELAFWIREEPLGKYARMAGFLYEFLTGKTLSVPDTPPAPTVPLLDPETHVTELPRRSRRWRIENNLLGDSDYCPVIRKRSKDGGAIEDLLRESLQTLLSGVDSAVLERAASWLYTRETRSTFGIEGEKANPSRAERFIRVLVNGQKIDIITKNWLTELQNAIVSPPLMAQDYRTSQNWIGQSIGYRERIDFLPPAPTDLPDLMDGWTQFANRILTSSSAEDTLAKVAAVSYGFVFLHPYMDGNGRLHRALIHQLLSVKGITPDGLLLPVSAVMLLKKKDYMHSLEAFSAPLRKLVPADPGNPSWSPPENDPLYFRYFDATPQARFLEDAILESAQKTLPEELHFLRVRDRIRERFTLACDWPNNGSMELFLDLLTQGNGKLSKNKRKVFKELSDDLLWELEELFSEEWETPPGQG